MYLYIFEDESQCQNARTPDQSDLDGIDAGVLSVIRFAEGQFQTLQSDGHWLPVQAFEELFPRLGPIWNSPKDNSPKPGNVNS